jgi:hypothetical protein
MGIFTRQKKSDEGRNTRLGGVKSQVEAAREAVLYDAELGLYQRWYFELRLREEAMRSTRYGSPFALMVVIMEPQATMSEKTWNLQVARAAYVTARAVRSVDLTAVLDHSVFAICLIHCDRAGAEVAGQRLSASLGAYPHSIGGVIFPDDNLGPDLLLDLARNRAARAGETSNVYHVHEAS